MKKYIFLMLGLLCFLSGCTGNGTENREVPGIDTVVSNETENQEDNMKREFCKVAEDTENFVLKNTAGDLYHLDLSFQGDFKSGDEVLLIYTNRTQIEEGVYEAEVYAVYPDRSDLAKPANDTP